MSISFFPFQEKGKAQLVYFWLAAETFRLADQTQTGPSDDSCILTSDKSAVEKSATAVVDPDQSNLDRKDDDLLDLVDKDENPFNKEAELFDEISDEENLEADFGNFQLSSDRNSVSMLPDFRASISSESGAVLSECQISRAEFLKQNAVNIFTRYICKDSAQPVDVPEKVRAETLEKICCTDGVDSTCFSSAQTFVYSILLNSYYERFLSSSYFVSYQLDRVTCRNLTLADVLYSDITISHFMEFIEAASLTNLFKCFLSIQNFKLNYEPKSSSSDTSIIFNQFFNLESPQFLMFPEKLINNIELSLVNAKKRYLASSESSSGPSYIIVGADVFDIPFFILGNALKFDIFPHFLRSRFYRQLKRELELSYFTLQNQSGAACKGGQSESFSSECQTLLQDKERLDYVPPPILREIPGESKEDERGGVTALGHVNAIGEYVPQYESLPDKKPERVSVKSKIKNLLSRKENSEVEYEAWVTAHKIVNDVNRETLYNASGAVKRSQSPSEI